MKNVRQEQTIREEIMTENKFNIPEGYFESLSAEYEKHNSIPASDYEKYNVKRRIVSENIAMTPAMIERNLKQIAIGFGSSEDMQQYLDNVTKAEYTTIGQCPDKKVQLESIQLMSDGYYMGFREYDGMFYFCKIKPDYNKETAVSEPSYIDFTKNHWRTPKYNQFFEDIFNSALCVFDTPETLNAFLRWLRHNRNRI